MTPPMPNVNCNVHNTIYSVVCSVKHKMLCFVVGLWLCAVVFGEGLPVLCP